MATPLEVVDISHLNEAEQAAQLQALGDEFLQRPFNLAEGPLVAVLLVKTGAEAHRCYISLHHIIADGWSLSSIMGELGELYSALIEKREAHLAELPVQYLDYAAWERATVQGEYEAQLVGLLARSLGRDASGARFPDRQATTGTANLRREDAQLHHSGTTDTTTTATESAGTSNPVHDNVVGDADNGVSLQWASRFRYWVSLCGSRPFL